LSFARQDDAPLGDDASVSQRLRASEGEQRRQRRRAEQASEALTSLRKENHDLSAQVGELEGKLKGGAASQDLEAVNDALVAEIKEVVAVADEAMEKVSSLEESKKKLEQASRAQTREIGQLKYQNEHYCRQHEQTKEDEKKGVEKLKTYKYIDAVLSGADEQPLESHSREQLMKLLAWRTKAYKDLSAENDKAKERREAQFHRELQQVNDRCKDMQKQNRHLQHRVESLQKRASTKVAFKPLASSGTDHGGDAAGESLRDDSEEAGTDGYDTGDLFGEESDDGDGSGIGGGGSRGGSSGGAGSQREPTWQRPRSQTTPQPSEGAGGGGQHGNAKEDFLRGTSLQHGAMQRGGIVITKSTGTAGQAPSLKRVSAIAAAQRSRTVVGGGSSLNRGTFIQQQRDASGGIVTVLRPETAPSQRSSVNAGVRSKKVGGVKRGASSAAAMQAAANKAPRIERFFGRG